MTQLGLRLRNDGLDSVESNNAEFVAEMRAEAERVARAVGIVTVDDLRVYAERKGMRPSHPNCWGSIFRGSSWREVGRRKSTISSNHARKVTVWSLVQ